MIRLPATTIVLGRSDLLDYEKRQQTRGRDVERVSETDKLNVRLARITVRSQPGSNDHVQSNPGQISTEHARGHEPAAATECSDVSDECDPESPSYESIGSHEDALQGEEHGFSRMGLEPSPENPIQETTQPVFISKDDFYYGGFIFSSPRLADYTPQTPNDASTPQNLHPPSSSRFLSRNQLPRSPLYVSQNASTSPEHRPTSGLTPRVASRIATHNTPGIIFSQPARRPPRITTRTTTRAFRHQTNSFSFDSSERSSAAYEQERAVSTSTDGRVRHTDRINLRDDLRGSSLHSSRTASSSESYRIAVTPDAVGEGESMIIDAEAEDDEDDDWERNIESVSTTPFALPPPFSTVSRSVSRANSLPHSPAREYLAINPPTSPISPCTIQSGSLVSARHPSGNSGPTTTERYATQPSSPSSSRFNPVNIINRAISIYRTRSPFSRQGSPQPTSPSASPTPRQDQSRQTSANMEPTTPSRVYRVYNDAESPDLQPQTPANLPESRHQSRYHPSYTAPVTRAAARRGLRADIDDAETLQQSLPRQRRVPVYTPLRGRRSSSPVGLTHGGFQGLYGGRENGDEEQSWVEGVRFNNAETRLWGSRDAQNDGGSLRRTPEPDDWRIGRRN